MKKKILTLVLSSAVIGTTFFGASPVFADDYDHQIKQAEREAVENETAADNINRLIAQLSIESSNAQDALHNLQTNIERNENKLTETNAALETAHREMESLIEEIAVLEKNIQSRSKQLEAQARTIQVNGQPSNYLEFILEADSLTDIFGRIDIVTHIVQSNNKMIEDQLADQKAVKEKSEETERKIVQQNALAAQFESVSADLETQQISQTALLAQVELEKSTAANEREQLITQRDEALQLISAIENEQAALQLAFESTESGHASAAEEPAVPEVSTTSSAEVGVEATHPEEVIDQSQRTPAQNVSRNKTANQTDNVHASDNSSHNNETAKNTAPQKQAPVDKPDSDPEPAPAPKPAEKPKAEPKPVSKPDPKPSIPASGNVLSIAGQYIGVPYLGAGTTPNGFDCSGFTQYVFAQAGKSISRTTRSQFANAQKVSSPQPGDLIFFSNQQNGHIDHVGIVTGNGQFIGAQSSTGVAYASYTSGYWGTSGRVVGFGRY